MTESTVFYCEMCKEKHSRIEPRSQCPVCGRTFCHESLVNVIQAGLSNCPYCEGAIKDFSNLSWEIKSSLIPTTTFAPKEKETTKPIVRNQTKITKSEEAWSEADRD